MFQSRTFVLQVLVIGSVLYNLLLSWSAIKETRFNISWAAATVVDPNKFTAVQGNEQ